MNKGSVVKDLEEQKRKVEAELEAMEAHIFALETSYLANTQSFGNMVRGYDPLISQKGTQYSGTAGKKPGVKSFKEGERVFSMSSVTSKALGKGEEEEDVKMAGGKTASAVKRKSKGSKGDFMRKKQKAKKEEDSDFSDGGRS